MSSYFANSDRTKVPPSVSNVSVSTSLLTTRRSFLVPEMAWPAGRVDMPGTEDAGATATGIVVLGTEADPDTEGVITGDLVLCVADDGKKVGFCPL